MLLVYLIFHSSRSDIRDELAADEQEHQDKRENREQGACNDHRVVCVIESV